MYECMPLDSGCVEEATFETSSYKNVVPDARYSNNFAGACFRCARGEGFECGGDALEAGAHTRPLLSST